MTIGLTPGWARQWCIVSGACVPLFVLIALLLPDPLFSPDYSTVITARDGELLGGLVARDGQWRFPPDCPVPEKFVRALVAFEDKRFYLHFGVDYSALVRALVTNLSRGEVTSGASTITMQVIRLSRGKRGRNVAEKLVEIALGHRLEMAASKRKILELFAAHAPFGGNIVGIEAASWRYFGRSPERLSWAEAAMLAVLPNNPSLVHPGRNRELLLGKRNRLLARLRDTGEIDADTFELSVAEPLPDAPFPLPSDALHLVQRARRSSSGAAGSVKIRTTIDYSLQERVYSIAKKYRARYLGYGVRNIAALLADTDTNTILAYVGNVFDEHSRDTDAYVDIVRSPRSTGSLLKPFLFAACLDSGEISPDRLLMDIPSRLGSYIPENNSKTYAGAVTAHDALVQSLNIPFVLLLRSFGTDRFHALLEGLGMSTLVRDAREYGLPLVTGGAEGTLEELTSMYSGLVRCAKRGNAEQGAGAPSFSSLRFLADRGIDPVAAAGEPLSPAAAWTTLTTLLDVVRPGEEGAWRDYLSSKNIAWKTGTSYGFRDAWAIGVTSKYAVGIWVGNADGEGRPEIRGAHLAAPVLFDVFSGLPDTGWIEMPESGWKLARVCVKSGFAAGPSCGGVKEVRIPERAMAQRVCPYCRIVHLDRTGRWQVTSDCEEVSAMKNESRFVLTPAMEWFYRKNNASYEPLPPFKPGCREDLASKAMNILYPEQGANIYIPIELDGSPGETVCQAVHRDPTAVIYWHMDGAYLGETSTYHQIEFRVGRGKHAITIVDSSGNTMERSFFVLSGK